jgi:hypothetical protein
VASDEPAERFEELFNPSALESFFKQISFYKVASSGNLMQKYQKRSYFWEHIKNTLKLHFCADPSSQNIYLEPI